LSSNPDGARRLINRYRKNPIPAIGNVRPEKSQIFLEKVALTRSKDLRNAGGFFIRALEKDYREPVTNTKPPPPPKKKRVEPKPEEPPATDEERAQTGAKLREFIETLRTSR
jgi:hypothetical protein